MDLERLKSNALTNGQRKRLEAARHNAEIEKNGYPKAGGRVLKAMQPSQRNALVAQMDKTSGTPNRSRAGRRMRARAGATLDGIMRGRQKINALMARGRVNFSL